MKLQFKKKLVYTSAGRFMSIPVGSVPTTLAAHQHRHTAVYAVWRC